MIVVIQRMCMNVVSKAGAVFDQFGLGKLIVATNELASDAAATASASKTVLHGRDLHVVPVLQERAEHSTMEGHVSVEIRGALPEVHMAASAMAGAEMRDQPLIDPVVGNSV